MAFYTDMGLVSEVHMSREGQSQMTVWWPDLLLTLMLH